MPDPQITKDAVIIGGGISGLATAYRLQKAGLAVLLLEKSAKIGGAIRSEKVGEFLIDYGPNSTLDTSPKIGDFIKELGLTDRRVNANAEASRRYILKNGELVPLPMNPPQFLKSGLFSFRAKLRLLKEPFVQPAPENKEETIAEFVERRLGREFLDYAINPFIAGVYAGDPDRLSVRSAVAKIYALEKNYGSLIKGAVKGARERKKRADTDKTKAQLFSFKDGMHELSDALASALGNNIQTQSVLEEINPPSNSNGLYSVTYANAGKKITVQTKSLIFTSPAFVTAEYLRPFDQLLAKKLSEIFYPPVAVVFLGFEHKVPCRPLDGFGFLVPKVESRKILGTIWSSTIFPNRAPNSGMALTTFVGGMRQPELTNLEDAELTDVVLQELKSLMALEGKPDIVRIKRWQKAIPQYELGHQERMDAVERFESANPGIFVSGNFRNGISVGDCIVQSEAMAEKVLDFCKHPQVSENVNVVS
ncbi:protoporphyrinogen oxidase [candidate division KSB1 bacterium]|nr:protoporphyrinogen oxidase [candidate division KSB1 bacterium]NIR73372.1 protoporphyrinogen oxidase [candidate division KSB1 bacterium]NIS27055.1 protoporphyrinogen oxidase [candidate division KSB1 bacterium]NIT73895.1 protoporphyrinogen oxidase [candidate division KSB1 bacterium]NIU27800.1 protoporphyrinogen oxidase [candidate division KSB1 bacterium]